MEVSSIDNFALDGVSCSTVGLWCDTPPIQVLSTERGSTYKVGTDEDMFVSDDSFDDISFRFTAYAFFADDFDQSEVYAFLRNKKKLTISRNDGYYWKIRTITCTPSQSQDGKKIKYQITVKCAPWRYVDNEAKVTVSQSGTNVECGGTRYCKPIYKITLSAYSGTGSMTVNNQQVTVVIPQTMGTLTFYIDSEKMLAYDGNNVVRTMYTSGIFPWMAVGNNAVSFGGIVESIEIQRNQRYY